MLNVKYYKDLNHNFLIISDKIKEEEENYQYRMINGNKIKCLLECRIRYVNEECSFYYEISSKQNLKSLFNKKSIGYGEMFRLLESIKAALQELEDFLLDSRCLLLMPEYIYAEPEARQYFFLYYPCADEEDKKLSVASFAEFLIDRVEHEEEEAVNMAYKIYESVQDEEFILSHILEMFHAPAEETEKDMAPSIAQNIEQETVEEDNAVFWPEDNAHGREDGRAGNGREEGIRYLPAVGILAFLCAAAAAGIFSIKYFFTLSVEEKLASAIGMIILVILASVLFLFFIINVCKRRHSVKEPLETYETFRSEEEKTKVERNKTERTPTEGRRENRYREERSGEEYGNTVFLDTSSYKKENKLYGTNKGNKYHIDLDKLPCTIGKMAGNVDVVIKDSTISRIHARFTGKEGEIYVTDMNSTNGTFKNGLRLEPNETVQIEQGDELRFGRMTFCYR